MRFCQDHWDQLRQAVVKHGMGYMISATAEEAAHRTLHGPTDPLILACVMVTTQVVAIEGDSELCPVCVALDHWEESGFPSITDALYHWIEAPVIAVADRMETDGELPLVGAANVSMIRIN